MYVHAGDLTVLYYILPYLDLFNLKTFADSDLIIAKMLEFVMERTESIVVKDENAGHQHFLLFP